MIVPRQTGVRKRHRQGRPRSSNLSRSEQLRAAKQRQHQREQQAGISEIRLKLPAKLGRRLAFVTRQAGFNESLAHWLDAKAIEVAQYPQLHLLCWNRRAEFMTPLEAWNLYERNWRFVEVARLTTEERSLIRRLGARFGGGHVDV